MHVCMLVCWYVLCIWGVFVFVSFVVVHVRARVCVCVFAWCVGFWVVREGGPHIVSPFLLGPYPTLQD